MDAGYKNPEIARTVIEDEKIPVMPYTRPMTKKAFSRNMNMSMMNTMIAAFARKIRF